MGFALRHLETLHEVFKDEMNFPKADVLDYKTYQHNSTQLEHLLRDVALETQLYGRKGRQMILGDLYEYIFFGRGYYSAKTLEDKQKFIELVMRFVNLLMHYETITVSNQLRQIFLEKLAKAVPLVQNEEFYSTLIGFEGSVGLKKGASDASLELDKYFDSLLPKTAGGLWHELLVYIFILRNNLGYILSLLLSQRLLSLYDNVVPPDFLLITHDKHMYGIEVGIKKEIQSGLFSLKTDIPTATVDTINSRASDRCPICRRWIPFCDYVIKNYSNTEVPIQKMEVRCLDECNIFTRKQVAAGECPYSKYSRNRIKKDYSQHDYTDGLHYHYRCVLEKVPANIREKIVLAEDSVAIKTHYPHYSGLEALMQKQEDNTTEES